MLSSYKPLKVSRIIISTTGRRTSQVIYRASFTATQLKLKRKTQAWEFCEKQSEYLAKNHVPVKTKAEWILTYIKNIVHHLTEQNSPILFQ